LFENVDGLQRIGEDRAERLEGELRIILKLVDL
jgi:hypothetical protein